MYRPWHSRSVAVLLPRRTEFDAIQSAWSTSNPVKFSAPVPLFSAASTFPLTPHIYSSVTTATRSEPPTPLNNPSEDNDSPDSQPLAISSSRSMEAWRRHVTSVTAVQNAVFWQPTKFKSVTYIISTAAKRHFLFQYPCLSTYSKIFYHTVLLWLESSLDVNQYRNEGNFNLLKPAGHVMHQQFNVQQLYVLPTLYLCFLYLSENKQRLVPLTA